MKDTYNIKNIIIFITIILIVIVSFYGITLLIVEKRQNETTAPDNESVIKYDEILVGSLYQQSETTYYVLATTANDTKSSDYNSALATYSAKEDSLATYTIDLDNGFNKKYLKEESNFEEQFPTFKTSTLLKIENSKITEIYEGTEIKTILDTLSKNLN